MITRCAAVLAFFWPALGMAADSFLSPAEVDVVRFLNEARAAPAAFAEHYLSSAARHTRAAAECLNEMKSLQPRPPLAVSRVLSRSAQAHAEDLGRTGNTGHFGSDKSNLSQRIFRFGTWTGSIAENCAFGIEKPLDIVTELLVDDGQPDRGHRRAILDPKLRHVGVGIRPHRWYRIVCVQDFAQEVSGP